LRKSVVQSFTTLFLFKHLVTIANQKQKSNWFETFASKATKATGSNYAFITACVVIIVWIVTGLELIENEKSPDF